MFLARAVARSMIVGRVHAPGRQVFTGNKGTLLFPRMQQPCKGSGSFQQLVVFRAVQHDATLRHQQQREGLCPAIHARHEGPQGSPIEGGEQLWRCGNRNGVLLTQQSSTAE